VKPLYPYVYTAVAATFLSASYFAFVHARASTMYLPLDFHTPYLAARSTIAAICFGFFFVLMFRHVFLLVLSVADQVERWIDDRRRARRVAPPFRPLVSIIAPAFNEGPCIEASIRSLLTLDYPRYEVLIVDDGSSDDTLERARKLEGEYENARVLVLWKPNGGKSSALNFGIQRAAGEFFVTMDSDSVLRRDTLTEAMKYLEDERVAAVAGSVEVVNPFTLWSRLQYLEYVKGLNLVRRAQGVLRQVSIVPGPIGVFRRSAVEAIGGYAHDTFAEDCDLTLKLLMAGWKIRYEPCAEARTEAPEELIPLIKQRYRWTRGILQALRKHRRALLWPRGSLLTWATLWYMIFEGLVWPIMTGVTVAFTLIAGLDPAMRSAAIWFWAMLLLLDASTTLYCLALEERDLKLLLYAPVERMVYTMILDVCRILASVEELFGLQMSWGKLDRKGRT
jgi:cellulose synthase/poly-beta-1,6-N-acetylglucosamine synthase-like glycosyltransferase